MPDYSPLDRSSAIHSIFYPREDATECPENAFDLFVPVEEGISIHCRFYIGSPQWPAILFFHGNGEVVSDYDEIAPFYSQKGLNLIVADYRGYGMSGGAPTLTDLVHDAHVLFQAAADELGKRRFGGQLWVMGRSLGSISALELASRHRGRIKGLIIDSGFTSVSRIVWHLGIPGDPVSLKEIDQACVENARTILLPALIIHGERDTLVPLKEAEELYRHLGTARKELLTIPSADHNNILLVGFQRYFEALQKFVTATQAF